MKKLLIFTLFVRTILSVKQIAVAHDDVDSGYYEDTSDSGYQDDYFEYCGV